MPYQALVFSVFIASPGDVASERRIVEEVIGSYNSLHARATGTILLPVRWEVDAVPQVGKPPQSAINAQLVEAADIVVGVFWTRLGTPTAEALSGSVEEIELARKLGKPCLVYFSQMPVVPDNLDREEFDRLIKWRTSLASEALYRQYKDLAEFRGLLSNHLVQAVRDLIPTAGEPEVPDTVDGGAVSSYSRKEFLRGVRREVDALATLWEAEKGSNPRQISSGQQILAELGEYARTIIPALIAPNEVESRKVLAEVIAHVRKAQEWRLYLDGGKSFHAFFDLGDKLFAAAIQALESI